MSTYPYAEPALAGLTFKQTPVLPSLQLRQRPQAMLKGTEQMSPTSMNWTSSPFSTTSPVISCPRVCPTGAVVRPRTMCWSEPQMLVETIFRMTAWGAALVIPIASATSSGTSSFGYSMSSTATSPGPLYTTTLLSAISPVLLSLWSVTMKFEHCFPHWPRRKTSDFGVGASQVSRQAPFPFPRTCPQRTRCSVSLQDRTYMFESPACRHGETCHSFAIGGIG